MQKKQVWSLIFCLVIVLTGCGSDITLPDTESIEQVASSGREYANKQAQDFVQTNEYAQQAQSAATQAYDQAKQQATQLSEQAKAEAQKQYQKLKEDAKNEAKNQLNKKIDEAFEHF